MRTLKPARSRLLLQKHGLDTRRKGERGVDGRASLRRVSSTVMILVVVPACSV